MSRLLARHYKKEKPVAHKAPAVPPEELVEIPEAPVEIPKASTVKGKKKSGE